MRIGALDMTRLAIIFSLLFVTPAWAELVLYCQEQFATGILKKNGYWQTGKFKPARYTVKFDEKKNDTYRSYIQANGMQGFVSTSNAKQYFLRS